MSLRNPGKYNCIWMLRESKLYQCIHSIITQLIVDMWVTNSRVLHLDSYILTHPYVCLQYGCVSLYEITDQWIDTGPGQICHFSVCKQKRLSYLPQSVGHTIYLVSATECTIYPTPGHRLTPMVREHVIASTQWLCHQLDDSTTLRGLLAQNDSVLEMLLLGWMCNTQVSGLTACLKRLRK